MSFRRFSLAALGVGVAFALSACGSAAGTVDPGYYDNGGYTDPTGNGSYYPSTGATTNPYVNTPVTPGYGTMGLTATVTKVKNGVFLGMGKLTASVEVANPTAQPLTGTVTVTFTNGGKPTKYNQVQSVSVGAGQTTTLNVECKNWAVDNLTVDVTTDQSTAVTTNPYGTTTNPYGTTTNPYGQTY